MHSHDATEYQYPVKRRNSCSVVPTSEVRMLTMLGLMASCGSHLFQFMAKVLFINQARVTRS